MGKEPRIEAAEQALRDLRLLAPAAEETPGARRMSSPATSGTTLRERLESSEEFRLLTAEVEKKLGKRLTTPDVGVLLGLNDYLGLPADVIFLLVNHCVERVTAAVRRGPAARPCGRSRRRATPGPRWGIDTQSGRSGVPEKVRGAAGDAMPAVYAGAAAGRPAAGWHRRRSI